MARTFIFYDETLPVSTSLLQLVLLGWSCFSTQAQVSHFSFTGGQPGPSSR